MKDGKKNYVKILFSVIFVFNIYIFYFKVQKAKTEY